MQTTARYDFSVVMAVYQVEDYLREAVDSIIGQKYPFQRIQIILVDDGSPDRSGQIADDYAARYPDNIVSLHKENGRQAAARNYGLQYAEGEWITFTDPDDKLSPDTFSKVSQFIASHGNDTNIISVPIYMFGAQWGPHWQNGKYKRGTRLINLLTEPNVQQASAASAFYPRRIMNLLHFEERLTSSEDFRMNLSILMDKPSLGVVAGCRYEYRKRDDGASTIDGQLKNRAWYFDNYRYLFRSACEEARAKLGYLPAFVQHALLCDLQWRFRNDYAASMSSVLSPEEIQQYYRETAEVVRLFDDEYIAKQQLHPMYKTLIYTMKHGCAPTLTTIGNDFVLHYGNIVVGKVNTMPTELYSLQLHDHMMDLQGSIALFGLSDDEPVTISISINGTMVGCSTFVRPDQAMTRLGHKVRHGIGFKCTCRLPDETDLKLQVICTMRGRDIPMTNLKCSRYMPVSSWIKETCCVMDGRRVRIAGGSIIMDGHTGRKELLRCEYKLCKALKNGNKEGMKKAPFVRLAARLAKPFCRKKIWLFSDRIRRAGDNGEAMFRYVAAHCPRGVKPIFLLHSKSVDYARMKQIGRVVPFESLQAKLLYLLASVSVSSSGDLEAHNPFDWRVAYYGDMMHDLQYVFLQHGITKDDQTHWLNRWNQHINCLICSSGREWEAFHAPGYGYDDEALWLTGMPRFDLLQAGEIRCITIMPTWRESLMTTYDPKAGIHHLNPQAFVQSDYYRFYQALLTNERLISACRQHHITLQFYPHPNVLQHIGLFHPDPSVVVPGEDKPYREIYAESGLIVTDYSSAVFDFAYLRRPVLYAQFDRKTFFSGTHVYKAGYFDYDRDGFGPVTGDLESTVDAIIASMDNHFVLTPEYRKRIDDFFAFNDKDNCRRVLDHIVKLPGALPKRS